MSDPVTPLTPPDPVAPERPLVLEVRGLTRHFGELKAVSDVSFSIRTGEIFGFVGPNGAGKTTLLRMLATLDVPTSGDAIVAGCSVVDQPDLVRPFLGYMPDRSGVYEDTSVAEYLDFFARAYGLKGRERTRRVESVVEFTQLGDLREQLLTTLSKGMKQRAALARTLLNDPKLLLLDEPADGLDPRARIELRELLKALAEAGKSILISSHILTELSELCDGAAIIEQGRLLARGRVSEILEGAGRPGSARMVVRLVSRADDALRACERFLLERPSVSAVRIEGGFLRFVYEGDAGKQSELLRALVAAGHPVCAFGAKEADLEDAFMHVTRGRVQ